MKYTFPADAYGQRALLMQVDAALLPIVAGKLKSLAYEQFWIDTDSWQKGYNAVAEMLLMQNGIIESIDRLYRLIDSIHNGTAYSLNNGQVEPAIPATPATPEGITAGLRRQLLDMQGLNPTSWPFGFGAKPTTLADVASALKQQSPAEIDKTKQLMATLSEISAVEGGISATTGVVSALGTWLGDAETGLGEGLMLATMLGGIAANAALMGLQAAQLDQLIASVNRLVTSMDGGETPAPTTNVIAELQAANEKLV